MTTPTIDAAAARTRPATVVILDFGAQYSQLIARRVREANVYSEILPHDAPWSEIAKREPAAIVLTGGPESTLAPDALGIDPAVFTSEFRSSGFATACNSSRAISAGRSWHRRIVNSVRPRSRSSNRRRSRAAFRSRRARGCRTATPCPAAARVPNPRADRGLRRRCDGRSRARHLWRAIPSRGRCTRKTGKAIIANFLHGVAGIAARVEEDESFVETTIAQIRAQVGEGQVICALSGGVDSAVAATLVARSIGTQLTCIFVDTDCCARTKATQ